MGILTPRYPDTEYIIDSLSLMTSAIACKIHDGLEVDLESGFPTRGSYMALEVDKRIASDSLARTHNTEKVVGLVKQTLSEITVPSLSVLDAPRKSLKMRKYYERVKDFPFIALISIAASYSGRTQNEHGIDVVIDGFDVTKNLFVKYTAEMAYVEKLFSKAKIRFSPDGVELCSFLRSVFERAYHVEPSELFKIIQHYKNLRPLRVTMSTIGPFYFPATSVTQRTIQADDLAFKVFSSIGDGCALAVMSKEVSANHSSRDSTEFRELLSRYYVSTKNILVGERVFVIPGVKDDAVCS